MIVTDPRVSITLCCYNSERYLDATLRSIVDQSFRDWELVIVNDGSNDATEKIVRRYVAEGYPVVYHFQANVGLAASRNRAVELSRGKFIAFIDHDDLWSPDKLERQMALFRNPRVGLVYSATTVIGHDGRFLREYIEPERMVRGEVLDHLFLGQFLACSTIVVRRSALEAVGPFRTDFTITEEYELLFRLAEKYEFDFIDEPLMQWRLHASNTTWKSQRARQETAAVLREVLARHPDLGKRLGSRVVRLRLAGFSCTPHQALLLRDLRAAIGDSRWYGALGLVREIASPLAKYAVARLPLPVVDASQRLLSGIRRRAATA